MCSAHPKYLTPRLSRAAAEILLYPLNMKPAPFPWSCRPWAPGTSTGDVTWITGVLQSSEQPAPHTKLTLHLLQLFLHTLQLLGQLITCRLARGGCRCDTGSCHPHCNTAQPILWRSTAAHPTLQAWHPGDHCQGMSITGVVPGKGAIVVSICQHHWKQECSAGCSHRVKSPKTAGKMHKSILQVGNFLTWRFILQALHTPSWGHVLHVRTYKSDNASHSKFACFKRPLGNRTGQKPAVP